MAWYCFTTIVLTTVVPFELVASLYNYTYRQPVLFRIQSFRMGGGYWAFPYLPARYDYAAAFQTLCSKGRVFFGSQQHSSWYSDRYYGAAYYVVGVEEKQWMRWNEGTCKGYIDVRAQKPSLRTNELPY
jgi:hypothetical protein